MTQRTTPKLHVKRGDKWLPVFCYIGGKIVTCEESPLKALPSAGNAWLARARAKDDLEFFRKKFGNEEFRIIPVRVVH